MSPEETSPSYRVLVVDDDEAVLELTILQLVRRGFRVVAAVSVTEALRLITSESFDVLITDLNMPNAGDGFTVLTAMRHSQPNALILLVSGYPDVERALATIALEPDEIIVKPFAIATLADLLSEKMRSRKPVPRRADKQRVAVILHRCLPSILADWLSRAKLSSELNHLNLPDNERTGYLSKLIEDVVRRLSESHISLPGDALYSASAVEHGKMRRRQGYTSAMLVHESRLLQVTLFETLQNNLNLLDFSLLLPDVMKIADEVDAQLTQAMQSFTEANHGDAAA